MKKILLFILAAVMAFSAFGTAAFADEEYPEVDVVINGTLLQSDQPAVIIDSRTMVPLRAIGEALDATVNWDNETRTVTFSKNGKTVSLTIGSTVLYVSEGNNVTTEQIDVPAVIVNSRTLVPVRFISENFNAQVEWDNETRTVVITSESTDASGTVYEAIDKELLQEDKDLFDEGEKCTTFLNDYTGSMTFSQKEIYAQYCDDLSAVAVVLDSASQAYTNADLENILESLHETITGFEKIASELGIKTELENYLNGIYETRPVTIHSNKHHSSSTNTDGVDPSKPTATGGDDDEDTKSSSKVTSDDLDPLYTLYDKVSSELEQLDVDEMTDDQRDTYYQIESTVTEIGDAISGYSTKAAVNQAIDQLTSAQKTLANLIDEISGD